MNWAQLELEKNGGGLVSVHVVGDADDIETEFREIVFPKVCRIVHTQAKMAAVDRTSVTIVDGMAIIVLDKEPTGKVFVVNKSGEIHSSVELGVYAPDSNEMLELFKIGTLEVIKELAAAAAPASRGMESVSYIVDDIASDYWLGLIPEYSMLCDATTDEQKDKAMERLQKRRDELITYTREISPATGHARV